MKTLDLVEAAKDIGIAAHRSIDHRRKYSNEPYEVHLIGVDFTVMAHWDDFGEFLPYARAIAYLHDTLEDVPYTSVDWLRDELRSKDVAQGDAEVVVSGVLSLTDTFTKEVYPHLSRAQRKTAERARLGTIQNHFKLVKLADLINNTQDIVKHDEGFARVYLKEKGAILREFSMVQPVRGKGIFAHAFRVYSNGIESLIK